MRSLARQASKYLLASGCALMVDMGVLWVLVHYFGWWYLAAATTSFLLGMSVAYGLSVRLVFNHRRLEDRRVEFFSFTAIGAAGLTINAAVILFLVQYCGLHYLAAKCIAAGFTFTFNFFCRRQLLFVQRPSSRKHERHDYDLQR